MSTVLIVYLSIFFGGLTFIIVSFIAGLDHSVEIGHDMEHPGDVGAETMSPSFFSMKVISCFLMGVGLGATASHVWITASLPVMSKYPIDLVFGLAGGFAEGWLGWKIIKLFLSQQGSSNYTIDSFVGRHCQVTNTIAVNGIGEISGTINGVLRSLDVKSESGSEIKAGTMVEVISISGSIGIVRPVSSKPAE